MGKPIFILNPIPGQEAANSDFLLQRGAAAKVNRVEDLPYGLGQLLGSKKLAEMGRAAKKSWAAFGGGGYLQGSFDGRCSRSVGERGTSEFVKPAIERISRSCIS